MSPHTQNWNPAQYEKNARFVSDLGIYLSSSCYPPNRVNEFLIRAVEMVLYLLNWPVSAAKSLALIPVQKWKNQSKLLPACGAHWNQCGHFTGKLRGYGNIVTIIDALESSVSVRGQIVLNPWYFPQTNEYRKLLEDMVSESNFLTLSRDQLCCRVIWVIGWRHLLRPTFLPCRQPHNRILSMKLSGCSAVHSVTQTAIGKQITYVCGSRLSNQLLQPDNTTRRTGKIHLLHTKIWKRALLQLHRHSAKMNVISDYG